MARVFIDPHMFSVDWFTKNLPDLVRSKKVSFLFANCDKGNLEIGKVRQALEFKKRMMAERRALEPPADQMERHVGILNAHPVFDVCPSCDDPHVMAAIYLMPTKFVFSCDRRMAKCRNTIRGTIDKKYCAFVGVATENIYEAHKNRII